MEAEAGRIGQLEKQRIEEREREREKDKEKERGIEKGTEINGAHNNDISKAQIKAQ